jgi:hypothetical protein
MTVPAGARPLYRRRRHRDPPAAGRPCQRGDDRAVESPRRADEAAATICTNTKKVRRDRLEAELLDALFNELFTPAAVAYLTQQVDAAIARSTEVPRDRRARLERDLAQAKTELANVLDAIGRASSRPRPGSYSRRVNGAWPSVRQRFG